MAAENTLITLNSPGRSRAMPRLVGDFQYQLGEALLGNFILDVFIASVGRSYHAQNEFCWIRLAMSKATGPAGFDATRDGADRSIPWGFVDQLKAASPTRNDGLICPTQIMLCPTIDYPPNPWVNHGESALFGRFFRPFYGVSSIFRQPICRSYPTFC